MGIIISHIWFIFATFVLGVVTGWLTYQGLFSRIITKIKPLKSESDK